MIVTVFRSRLNPEAVDEYVPMARRMSELARTIPGYVSHKGFVADDGERVTIVEFETEDALREWSRHTEHGKAKRAGIESFFSEYKFQICSVIRGREWSAEIKAARTKAGKAAKTVTAKSRSNLSNGEE
jgi:heme-degrading monooxygenase HmoA